MLYLLVIVAVALVVFGFLVLSWGGAIIGFVLGAGLLVYIAAARRQDRSVGVVETGRRREPTGTPRSASGGADTANRRVGQED